MTLMGWPGGLKKLIWNWLVPDVQMLFTSFLHSLSATASRENKPFRQLGLDSGSAEFKPRNRALMAIPSIDFLL